MRQAVQISSAGIGAVVPLALLSGAIAVCAGLCWLLSNQAGEGRRRSAKENAGVRRDYFRVMRIGSGFDACWLLQGFGAYECSLRFDTWNQAMNQVRFRLEILGSTRREHYPPDESAPSATLKTVL